MCARLDILNLKCQRNREANFFPQVSSRRSVTRESIPGAGALLGNFLQIIKTPRGSGHAGTAVGDFPPSSSTQPLGHALAQAGPHAAPPPASSTIGPSWALALAKESSSRQMPSVEAQRAEVFHLKRSESRACSWPLNAACFSEGKNETNFQSGQRGEPAVPVEIQPLNPASSEAQPLLRWAPGANRVPFWMKQVQTDFPSFAT